MTHPFAVLILGTALSSVLLPMPGPDPGVNPPLSSPNVTHTKAMSVAVYPNLDHTKMHLMVENHVQVPLFVTFWNGTETLYQVKVGKRTRAFHSRFDISQLKDGEYRIEVSDGYHKVAKSFLVGTQPPEKEAPTRVLTTL